MGWVVTGYKDGEKNSSADDRRRATHLAADYALDSFGGLKEVGAALDYAISRLARENKQNNADPRRKVSKRYGDVASLHEAAYTACKAVMSAVNGNVVARRGNTIRLALDGYSGVLAANWKNSMNAWVITGYKENGKRAAQMTDGEH